MNIPIRKVYLKSLRTIFSNINKINYSTKKRKHIIILNKFKVNLLEKLGMKLGENTNIRPNILLGFIPNIHVGNNSGIGDYSEILSTSEASVFIGDNVMMAPEVIIYTYNHNTQDPSVPMIRQGFSHRNVYIGNDVWLGRRAMLLPGAKLNDGIIVAAGAVVPGKEFPSNSIIGGVPAKVIGYRK